MATMPLRALGLALAASAVPAWVFVSIGEPNAGLVRDPLASLGLHASGGATAGYLPDRACQLCHRELYAGYQDVAMARAFSRARLPGLTEDLQRARVVHEPSGQHFEMVTRGDRLLFRRFQLDERGERVHLFEAEVDWILGSGNHARTYLYRTPAGELYQLPIAWYSQEGIWGMAPGYDRPDHEGVTRRVRRECMFCHNAYPEAELGSDTYGEPPLYPAELPEGIGCQRCHGPGAEHVRRALASETTLDEVRAAIVQPGKLPAARRDDLCLGCHLQPSVALPGLRRFERADYSFRPGEALADYLVSLDVDEAAQSREERFEINHHPYRLRQSRCFEASAGALSCLTCHDPHRKVPAGERAAHYRSACLGCHESTDQPFRHPAGIGDAARADCVACHMPARRPQDVVHVVMTDHLIRRRPGGPELTAPRAETEPEIVGLEILNPASLGSLDEVELYRALAIVRASKQGAAVDRLRELVSGVRPASTVPYLDLADALIGRNRAPAAEAILRQRLGRAPDDSLLRERLGLALAAQRRWAEAERELTASLEDSRRTPFRPEARFNLALALLAQDRAAEAGAQLERAVAERPNLAPAWYYLGVARRATGQDAAAIEAFRRAVAIDLRHSRSHIALAQSLAATGDRAGAARLLRHALTSAGDRRSIEQALLALEASP